MNNGRDNLQKQREDLEKEEEELLAEVTKLRSYFARVASYLENKTKAITTSRSHKTELYQLMTEPSKLCCYRKCQVQENLLKIHRCTAHLGCLTLTQTNSLVKNIQQVKSSLCDKEP